MSQFFFCGRFCLGDEREGIEIITERKRNVRRINNENTKKKNLTKKADILNGIKQKKDDLLMPNMKIVPSNNFEKNTLESEIESERIRQRENHKDLLISEEDLSKNNANYSTLITSNSNKNQLDLNKDKSVDKRIAKNSRKNYIEDKENYNNLNNQKQNKDKKIEKNIYNKMNKRKKDIFQDKENIYEMAEKEYQYINDKCEKEKESLPKIMPPTLLNKSYGHLQEINNINKTDQRINLINTNNKDIEIIRAHNQMISHLNSTSDVLYPYSNRKSNYNLYQNTQIGRTAFDNSDYISNNSNYFNHLSSESNKKDIKFCSNCLEIYHYFMENNDNVRICRCFNCGNLIDQTSFEYFVKNYLKIEKNEKNPEYKDIEKTTYYNNDKDNVKFPLCNADVSKNKINISTIPLNPSNSDKIILNDCYKVCNKSNIETSFIEEEMKRMISKKTSNSLKKDIFDFKNDSKISKNVDSSLGKGSYSKPPPTKNKKVLISFDNDEASTKGLSLADAFREKKISLIKKLQSRSTAKDINKTLDNKLTRIHQDFHNKMAYETSSKENKKILNTIRENKSESKFNRKEVVNNLKFVSLKKEPSNEVLSRLINGRRISMSIKEMKDINKRLYYQLVEKKDIFVRQVSLKKLETISKNLKKSKDFSKKLSEKVMGKIKKE